jgi:hypothetical protein
MKQEGMDGDWARRDWTVSVETHMYTMDGDAACLALAGWDVLAEDDVVVVVVWYI